MLDTRLSFTIRLNPICILHLIFRLLTQFTYFTHLAHLLNLLTLLT